MQAKPGRQCEVHETMAAAKQIAQEIEDDPANQVKGIVKMIDVVSGAYNQARAGAAPDPSSLLDSVFSSVEVVDRKTAL